MQHSKVSTLLNTAVMTDTFNVFPFTSAILTSSRDHAKGCPLSSPLYIKCPFFSYIDDLSPSKVSWDIQTHRAISTAKSMQKTGSSCCIRMKNFRDKKQIYCCHFCFDALPLTL